MQEQVKTIDIQRDFIFRSPVRERLQIFLQPSDLYDPEEVLNLIESSELWLEKWPVRKLDNSEAAEQYCAEIGRIDAYMQLLDMYLDPRDGKEPIFKAAVCLLHNHGESVDPFQVLEALSSDMPLQLASDTILRMLRARLHHHHQGQLRYLLDLSYCLYFELHFNLSFFQIVHYLSCDVNIDTRLARLEERSRLVQINDKSLCDSCHARLGTKLSTMYPDDTVLLQVFLSSSRVNFCRRHDVLFKPGWPVSR